MGSSNFVDCEVHGRILGYVVCCHVIANDAPVAKAVSPNEDHLGEILCAEADHNPGHMTLICAQCALSQGWVAPRGGRPPP